MNIRSSAFGSTVLTGEDARRFVKHMEGNDPNIVAQKAVREGVALARRLRRDGTLSLNFGAKGDADAHP